MMGIVSFQVADSKHKQIRKLQLQHKDQIHEMERRLMQEEDASVALKEEIKNREMDIEKLRRTIKNVSQIKCHQYETGIINIVVVDRSVPGKWQRRNV